MKVKKQDGNGQIKTNQSFVHIKHSITIRQYKYWHILLKFFSEQIEANILPDPDGFYYVSRLKMSELIGYELMTRELKIDVEALRKEPIIINYLEKDGKPAIRGMGFISEYKITSNMIGFRLPSFIEKVVKGEDESRKLFLLLNWNIFNSFAGKYEAIIYKLCKDYVGIGRTPYFSIEEYREYIGLSINEYNETKSMLRRCVNEPIKKINDSEICDIKVKVELKKVGRTIVGLNFIPENKKQTVLPFEEFNSSPAFKFAKISISQQDQHRYLDSFTEEQVEASIERANNYIDNLKATGKTVIMGAIYNKAIMENWGQQILEERKIKEDEEIKKQKKLDQEKRLKNNEQRKKDEEIEKNTALILEYESYSDEIKIMLIESLLLKNKKAKIVYDPLKSAYDNHGVNVHLYSPMFKGMLLGEITSYKTKQEVSELLSKFNELDDRAKLIELESVINLDPSLRIIYEKYGIEAHQQDKKFENNLVQHLVLKNIVENID